MSKNILIIDDEELIVRSLAKLLQKNGYTVFVAKRGEDALVMAEEEDFDLIIADIRMPGMNGVETIKELNAHLEARNLSRRPVLFITGYADPGLEAEVKQLGSVCIHKPFDLEMFVSKVRHLLKQ